MQLTKETQWLCEHAKTLEKFSGQCVTFTAEEGIMLGKKKSSETPFLFHVPSKDELLAPAPFIRPPQKNV